MGTKKKSEKLERPDSFSDVFPATVVSIILFVIFVLGAWQLIKFLLKIFGILH